MKKFVHIGYPKNYSTSLQRSFFNKHPEIYYLGIGTSGNIEYLDHFISSTFEVFLKTSNSFKYKEVERILLENLNNHFQKASNLAKKWVGASCEHLSFGFSHDSIDSETKMMRLSKLWGKDTTIVMIIRNQLDLIKSMYREYVRIGFQGTYHDYINNIFKFQDRNFFYDFRYDLMYDLIEQYFDTPPIILQFENYRDCAKKMNLLKNGSVLLFDDFENAFELSKLITEMEHSNAALTSGQLFFKAKLNKKVHHDLSNPLYSACEIHRQKDYFSEFLKLEEKNEDIFGDVLKKRDLINKAVALSDKYSKQTVNFEADDVLLKKIAKFYGDGNRRLQELSLVKLKEEYYY